MKKDKMYLRKKIINIKYFIILYLFTSLITSCMGSAIEIKERWEGIHDNKLRIYINYNIPDDFDESNFDKKIEEILLKTGSERAMLILNSYILVNALDSIRDDQINSIIKSGKIIFKHCDENSCKAFIDYDVTGFINSK